MCDVVEYVFFIAVFISAVVVFLIALKPVKIIKERRRVRQPLDFPCRRVSGLKESQDAFVGNSETK
jgi:Na+/serine symporter